MKKILILLIATLNLTACDKIAPKHPEHTENPQEQTYTCPMHPEVISNKPGSCPKCGMDLVLKNGKSEEKKGIALEDLLMPTNEFVVSSIPVTTIKKENNSALVTALGKVEYDTRQIGSISSRVSGRIDKLYVRYKYQRISKGQRIMDIYSPELLTAQQNLLFLVKNDPSNKMMINAAKQKLILLGMSSSQLQSVMRKGRPDITITVFSNYSGHIQKSGVSAEMGSATISQNEMPIASATSIELPLKEGMYVQKGQSVLSIYNPNRTWAVLNIFPQDINVVNRGQSVVIVPETNPESAFKGTIGFIEPFFREGSKTLTARVYFDNSVAKIPIGSQIKAEISASTRLSNWLPKTAVISLGMNKVVFKKINKGFMAHKIETGVTVSDKIQILSGLLPSDSVAINSQYLMDSESFIKTSH